MFYSHSFFRCVIKYHLNHECRGNEIVGSLMLLRVNHLVSSFISITHTHTHFLTLNPPISTHKHTHIHEKNTPNSSAIRRTNKMKNNNFIYIWEPLAKCEKKIHHPLSQDIDTVFRIHQTTPQHIFWCRTYSKNQNPPTTTKNVAYK